MDVGRGGTVRNQRAGFNRQSVIGRLTSFTDCTAHYDDVNEWKGLYKYLFHVVLLLYL